MPRYILIERNTGYTLSVTADCAANELTPAEAARLLDAGIREFGRRYLGTDEAASFEVYRAEDAA
jgi:hypothetical protein